MSLQIIETNDKLNIENGGELAAALFADLELSVAQEADIRAGFDLTGTPQPPKPSIHGWDPPVLNHNETLAEDEAAVPETLTDLCLTDAELDGIKGGPLCHATTALAWARVDGSPSSNHNETVAEDSAQEGEVEDLQLTAAQEQDVKAGGWGASMYQYAYNDPNVSRPPAAGILVRP